MPAQVIPPNAQGGDLRGGSTAVVGSPRLQLQGYPPMAGPIGTQTPADADPLVTWPDVPGPYKTQCLYHPMAGGPTTVAIFDLGVIGHPGSPHMFHWGLGARVGLAGVVGNSQGNPRALIVAPDRFRGKTYVVPGNVRNGQHMTAKIPDRSLAGPVSKGQ